MERHWLSKEELTQQLCTQEKALRQYIRFCGVKDEDVDEVMQEVLVIIWLKADTLRDLERLQPWIRAIAKRKAWQYRCREERHRQRHCSLSLYEEALEETGRPLPKELIYQEAEKFSETELYQLVQELGYPAAQILFLHYVYRETYEEIAENLHMKPATVRSTAARSREKLRRKILERKSPGRKGTVAKGVMGFTGKK